MKTEFMGSTRLWRVGSGVAPEPATAVSNISGQFPAGAAVEAPAGIRRDAESSLRDAGATPQSTAGRRAFVGMMTLGVVLFCAFTAHTQYAVPWFKIAGGGAMQSTGGVYTLSGTIGQPDAGRAAGGTYRSEGGFWGIAVQQAGYPPLNITQSGADALVSWVTIETGFILQTNADLGTPTTWTDSGLTPVVTTTNHVVTVPLNSAAKTFFRLRRP